MKMKGSVAMQTDEFYMQRAIELARRAEEIDEVPVGALVVLNGEIIAEAYNTRESTKCATHHAELLAIVGREDPRAFVVIHQVHEISGEGWRELKNN